MALNPKYGTWTVERFLELHYGKRLNLAPQFQRNSVWKQKDRDALIDSMLRGLPVPAVFLAKLSERGDVYDVVDGKQRLETFLAFMGFGEQFPGLPDSRGDRHDRRWNG